MGELTQAEVGVSMEGLLDAVTFDLVCKARIEITPGEEVRELCVRQGRLQVLRP